MCNQVGDRQLVGRFFCVHSERGNLMKNVRVIDSHCDVLYKLYRYPDLAFHRENEKLDVSLGALQNGGVCLQMCAIYLPSEIRFPSMKDVLYYIDIWYEKMLALPNVVPVQNGHDLNDVWQNGKTGLMLTLEGVEGLEGDPGYLRNLYRLGLRMVGITWNNANWAADGIMEPRQGGFTAKGKQLLEECRNLGLMLDVSHLSEKAFWELCEWSSQPFVASHSNARAICSHPRNLTNKQIQEIISRDGRIGITFVPFFLTDNGKANFDHIVRHIEHICSLGGEHQIGFGSDFDGIDEWTIGIESPRGYPELYDYLLKFYKESQVQRFFSLNWYSFLMKHLDRH